MPVTALLVDDEPLAREGLRMLLARDPEVSAIHEARDGDEAVEAIRALHPDIVFLDVQMPGMDGFAVVQEIGRRGNACGRLRDRARQICDPGI